MMEFPRLFSRSLLVFLSSTMCACMVVPKQVATYDKTCMVATRKIELTVEQVDNIRHVNCNNDYCYLDIAEEITSSALVLTTSAIISGSIALAGNTLYWLERQGNCPNSPRQENDAQEIQPDPNDEYLIREEIVTAKS